MVSILASNAVDCGFKPKSGQTKDYKVGIYCFSLKYTVLLMSWLTGWLGIRIMCQSAVQYLKKMLPKLRYYELIEVKMIKINRVNLYAIYHLPIPDLILKLYAFSTCL